MDRRRRLGAGLFSLALCVWCGWASGFHRSTAAAELTWIGSLAAVVVVDVLLWQGRRGRSPGIRLRAVGDPWPRPGCDSTWSVLRGLSWWLGLALVVVAWEVLGLDTGKHVAHLTISAITQAFRAMNAAMLLVWMLAGIGYGVARARAPITALAPSRELQSEEDPRHRLPLLALFPPATRALLLPASRSAGVAFWLAVVAAGLAIDLWARRSNGRTANSEELVRYVSGPMPANLVLVIAWIYAGYHLFAR